MPKYTIIWPLGATVSSQVEADDPYAAIEAAPDPDTMLCWQCTSMVDLGEVDYDKPTVLDEQGDAVIIDGEPVGDDA